MAKWHLVSQCQRVVHECLESIRALFVYLFLMAKPKKHPFPRKLIKIFPRKLIKIAVRVGLAIVGLIVGLVARWPAVVLLIWFIVISI